MGIKSSKEYATEWEKEEKKRANARESSYSAVQRIRTTLLKFDLEISRANAEIAILQNKIDFASTSSTYKDKIMFAEAVARKENYVVYKNHLVEEKNNLVNGIKMIADKYDGTYKNIFYGYFFEGKTYQELESETGYSRRNITYVIKRMKKDLDFEEMIEKKARK